MSKSVNLRKNRIKAVKYVTPDCRKAYMFRMSESERRA